ncbi:MAG: Tellurium resistance protein TerA [Micavibrio aeruginosavorus]|uniref:Tellurium resistance protein TerA n=1 Tax=Micavibrio aeruginosavorus TaxID=349221 RepID=A0A2W5N442_9BACT|nr:MAG: Tellurium resistance protein TerA [Micavibrio aeruginosavorus]
MPDTPNGSQGSLLAAERDRSVKSRYGGMGAAGYISSADSHQAHGFLSGPGEVVVVDQPEGGLPDFEIAVAWDNVAVENSKNFLGKFIKKKVLRAGVDLDLGCLYKLKNAIRGGLQAFGDEHGALKSEPYIALSRDERTGDREGPDERIIINGAEWEKIEKLLIYVYIYDGAENWHAVRPQVQVRVPGEQPMIVTLNTGRTDLPVCAVAGIENIRGGIKLTSCLEYFPGHAEMDRAFGYGLSWEDGRKRP